MITAGEGSIFDSDADAIVNAVNCVGVMGAGLAKAFKDRFPHMNEQYEVKCKLGLLKPGQLDIYVIDSTPKYIINFPTKDDWRNPSELKYILSGRRAMIDVVEQYKMKSVAIPALGCGLGGLSWGVVKPILRNLDALAPQVEWIIYDPQ